MNARSSPSVDFHHLPSVNPMSYFVQIALPVPIFKAFTYAVPEELRARAAVGARATVPFGKRTLTGVIVGHSEETDVEKVRDLLDVLDAEPIFGEKMLRFAEWMSE